MGLWSWLFPTPEQKLERAKADLVAGRFNDARLTAMELDLPGAKDVLHHAEVGLCKLNLAHAVSWAEAGDAPKVKQHVELADSFRHEENDAEFAEALATIQRLQREQMAEAQAQARAEDLRRSVVDGGFFEDAGGARLPLPEGVSEEEAEALEARLAILHESYPDDLRDGMIELGPVFSQAVLDLEEGRPDAALQALLTLPDASPLVVHERARAALALGDAAAAAKAWSTFAALAGGHRPIGVQHTAALLAHAQATTGDLAGALGTLRDARRTDPELAPMLYANLQEVTGDLAGSERTLRALLQKAGPQSVIYNAIARVRVADGRRVEAMQALETALRTCGCTPGKCGSKPPDLVTHRLLATLYLEDGMEVERALELAETARELVQQPMWEDAYLATLVARAQRDPAFDQMAERLRQVTPPTDPRWELVERYLAAA